MELDLVKTATVFVLVNVVGVGGLLVSEVMPMRIVLMMVLPSMAVFGLLMLVVGVKHGEYRATH